ncbi:MAG: SWIM zinc finger family protein [Nanoarchaeota archaeon]|nr:SWIM zinc finger family protein [Nanoarchaeota archaeon]
MKRETKMTELHEKYSENTIDKARGYIDRVVNCIKIGKFLYGKVQGTYLYRPEIDIETLSGECSCPVGSNCKHVVALYLNYKKGNFEDAENFIKNLNKMSISELKELILSKLQDNPDWIIKHNLRKNSDKGSFFKLFKKNFSPDKIEEADAVLPDLSFEQLLELYDYISENYESLSDKIYEDEEYNENHEHWEDEEYDAGLGELLDKLKEVIIQKSIKNKRVAEIVKREALRDEIIEEAESFKDFKEKIKKSFSKEEYLQFLLSLKNSPICEIKEIIDDSNKGALYDFIDEKTELVKKIAEDINYDTLIFSIYVREKNISGIVNNFHNLDNALKEDYSLRNRLKDIIDLFIKNKFRDEEIAKKLISENEEYNKKQLNYLASQISDFEFIQKNFDKDEIETNVELLKRMSQIDKQRTLSFIKNKQDLLGRHWSHIIPLFNFLRQNYSKDEIEEYIYENRDFFRTSSHLKKHLKEECGIFISQKEGELIVEMK